MEIPKEEDAKYKRMSVSQRRLVNIIMLVHLMLLSCGRAVIELPIKEFSSFQRILSTQSFVQQNSAPVH